MFTWLAMPAVIPRARILLLMVGIPAAKGKGSRDSLEMPDWAETYVIRPGAQAARGPDMWGLSGSEMPMHLGFVHGAR